MRAGADGYLLKNGPARHLIDAISYVRDGGQYFSPQLHRDGRDRHLLQEPPRQYPDSPAPAAQPASRAPAPEPEEYEDEEEEPAERQPRPARSARPKSRMGLRRTAPPGQWRERMREEAGSPGLGDRDYEIMSMMADGIKPILDRLDDFNVALRDAAGDYRSFNRDGDTPKIELHDPLAAHRDLLRKYTDADIHNVTAYLVTLQ